MWWRSRKKRVAQIDSLIGHGTEIHGDVIFSGCLHVDGTVKGNIFAEEGSNSVLTLSEQGTIHGEVRVANIILNGIVIGDVYVTDLELKPRSRITGNVYYNLLELMVGAEVTGSLIHTPDTGKTPLSLEQLKENVYPLHETE